MEQYIIKGGAPLVGEVVVVEVVVVEVVVVEVVVVVKVSASSRRPPSDWYFSKFSAEQSIFSIESAPANILSILVTLERSKPLRSSSFTEEQFSNIPDISEAFCPASFQILLSLFFSFSRRTFPKHLSKWNYHIHHN